MVIELQLKNTLYTSNPEATPVVSNTGSASAIDFSMAQNISVEGQSAQTSVTTTTSNQPQTKRSVDELYNSFASLFTQYGISISKNDALALIERIAGCKKEYLLNIENSEVQKLTTCLEAAIKKLQKPDGQIDMEALAELANDYNIVIHTGWTIEEFERAQSRGKESLKERLERFYPGKDPKAQVTNYFIKYFDEEMKKELEGVTDPTQREQIIEKHKRIQLRDFGRLLANSTDEEWELYKEAIKSLYAENKLPGLQGLFASLDSQETRTELAHSCNTDFLVGAFDKVDPSGEKSSIEEVSWMAEVIILNLDENGIKDFQEDFNNKLAIFYEENKEIIDAIRAKEFRGGELTKEEQTILDKINFFEFIAKTEFTATADNCIISNEFKFEHCKNLNKDFYKISEKYDKEFYRNILEKVASNSPKNISKEEFEKLMNEATNNNYQTVIDDKANDTISELNPPSTEIATNHTGTYYESTYSTNSSVVAENTGIITRPAPENMNPQVKLDAICNPETNSENRTTINNTSITNYKDANISEVIKYEGSKGFCHFLSQNGVATTIIEACQNLDKLPTYIRDNTIELYSRYKNSQENILRNISTACFAMFLPHTDKNVLLKIEDENFTNYRANQLVEDAVEEMELA